MTQTVADYVIAPPPVWGVRRMASPGDPGAHGRFDNQAQREVTGFDPVRLRGVGIFLLVTSIAGAFALGRLVGARKTALMTNAPVCRDQG